MAASLNHQEAMSTSGPIHPAPQRRRWGVIMTLTLVVALAHFLVTYEVSQQMAGLASSPETSIKRMEATYVSEIKQTSPPVAPVAQPAPQAPPQAPTVKKKGPKLAKAASAPDDAASAAKVAEEGASSAQPGASAPPEAVAKAIVPAPTTNTPDTDKPVAANEPAMAASGPAFIWPKATKVTYKMQVYYRGPVDGGQATVEWVRENQRYQVRLNATVPIVGWINMISEGKVVANGLSPERYESVNRLFFNTSKPSVLKFEEQDIILNSGERVPRVPDIQDPVSHLIHLAYKFMMHPQLLQQGNTIEMPLASSKKLDVIAYDVVSQEVLHTGMGDVPTMHVKPRRLTQDKNALMGDIWFAPSLQYLPIRIYAKWADDIYVDMQMDGAPLQTPGEPPEY